MRRYEPRLIFTVQADQLTFPNKVEDVGVEDGQEVIIKITYGPQGE